jgi:hypothetical protein
MLLPGRPEANPAGPVGLQLGRRGGLRLHLHIWRQLPHGSGPEQLANGAGAGGSPVRTLGLRDETSVGQGHGGFRRLVPVGIGGSGLEERLQMLNLGHSQRLYLVACRYKSATLWPLVRPALALVSGRRPVQVRREAAQWCHQRCSGTY